MNSGEASVFTVCGRCWDASKPGPPLVAPSDAAAKELLGLLSRYGPLGFYRDGGTLDDWEPRPDALADVQVALRAAYREGEEAGKKAPSGLAASLCVKLDAAESRARTAEERNKRQTAIIEQCPRCILAILTPDDESRSPKEP